VLSLSSSSASPRERLDRPPSRRRLELDACGIGFVADEQGCASREIVELALTGLSCVRHRGAVAADGLSGDGAGVLLPTPPAFLGRVAAEVGTDVAVERLGIVFAFLDLHDEPARSVAQDAVAAACDAEGLELLGWRAVPIDESQIGPAAREDLPAMMQALVARPAALSTDDAERAALRARRRADAACAAAGVRHYFASWSFSTITYKALVISDRLAAFFPDLAGDDFEAPFTIFHSRFSTNTAPAWERAQPFRHLCHNGEINTIQGNERRMDAPTQHMPMRPGVRLWRRAYRQPSEAHRQRHAPRQHPRPNRAEDFRPRFLL
jgi:glutamate synthase domain-containing protein 1